MGTLAILVVLPASLASQTATIAGKVTDQATATPLIDVDLELTTASGDSVWTGRTDELGSYFASGLEPGSYTLTATLIGYEKTRIPVELAAGETKTDEVRMGVMYLVIRLDPLVVTVNRSEQRLLEVPVSISVVEKRTLEEQTALTTIDYIAPLPGSAVLSGGLMTRRYTSRGPNFGQSANVRTMTDFRYTVLPAIEFNADYLVSTTTEDIERLELVRGPATVLYGPNSTRGALNLITRSPLDYPGTAIALAAGQQSTFQGTLRHASAFSDRVGFKLSGEYFTGDEWPFVSPADEAARAAAIAGGADPDTLLLGRTITDDQRIRVDGRFEWRPTVGTTAMLAGGLAQASVTDYVTFAGNTVSVDDGRNWFVQGRVNSGPLNANVYYNRNDLNDGWFPALGLPLREHSSAFWMQLQHGLDLGARESLGYGADFGRTIGRSDSTLYGSNEGNANVTEFGLYLKSTTILTPEVELLAAGRLDYHSIMGNAAFSPWLSVVYQPEPPHAIRFSVTRSFSTSGSIANFSDFVFAELAPLPYSVRNIGQGREQTFRRDCGGLCMRSPFNPSSAGGNSAFLPSGRHDAVGRDRRTASSAGDRHLGHPRPGRLAGELRSGHAQPEHRRVRADECNRSPGHPRGRATLDQHGGGGLQGLDWGSNPRRSGRVLPGNEPDRCSGADPHPERLLRSGLPGELPGSVRSGATGCRPGPGDCRYPDGNRDPGAAEPTDGPRARAATGLGDRLLGCGVRSDGGHHARIVGDRHLYVGERGLDSR